MSVKFRPTRTTEQLLKKIDDLLAINPQCEIKLYADDYNCLLKQLSAEQQAAYKNEIPYRQTKIKLWKS